MLDAQRERAARFRALHGGPGILLLCNVYDAASARVVEEAGFPAVATTSAGFAWMLGFALGPGEAIGSDAISYAEANNLFSPR